MDFFKPGNSVYVGNNNIGILLYECKEPKDTWAVLVDDNGGIIHANNGATISKSLQCRITVTPVN